MAKKQFKAESKKLMDLMIHSIYTHKEIFLRELISNASDAIDKRHFRALTDESARLTDGEFAITLAVDAAARTLTVTDNGIGMTAEELEANLGTIARSGSQEFKAENGAAEGVDIIGQFGVGFYSAFMVADRVTVESRSLDADTAHRWESAGVDGYTVSPCEKAEVGTVITLHLLPDTETEQYGEFLEPYRLRGLVEKYSDYIRYPIRMAMPVHRKKEGTENEYEDVTEVQTLNHMVPLWRKNKSEVTAEEYEKFYHEKFYDYEAPARVIHSHTEGQSTFNALLFIPKHAPFDYYTKEYEKGLQLYSRGVLIMDKCADLLPDYFSFVKGLVDSEDLSLNISREMLQHDHQLQLIAKTLEKKIRSELEKLRDNEREVYEEFFKAFGTGLKFGVYNEFGAHKDTLKDLLLFASSAGDKPTTLAEYTARMPEGQDKIYYACGETVAKIALLPQTDRVREKGYEILYLTENVDEFALRVMNEYDGKNFVNVCDEQLDLDTEDEKKALQAENEAQKPLLDAMKEALGDAVQSVRFTHNLKTHAACLTSEGGLSLEMEKTLNAMPGENKVKAERVLELNATHPLAEKLKTADADTVKTYAKLLYAQACLIGGQSIADPAELATLMCDLMLR